MKLFEDELMDLNEEKAVDGKLTEVAVFAVNVQASEEVEKELETQSRR